jgi:hypothetical protein
MPREAMDYSKCVIYKITCCDESVLECYVGHTTNFVKRKYNHKSNCKTNNLKLYQMIRENGGWNNWTMMPICEYPCENYIQACIKEEEYRIELQAYLNSYKCFGAETKQEYRKLYREEHIEHKKEQDKKYQKENKEHIAEKNKEWRDKNRKQILEQKKEYYKTHKEEHNKKAKEYHEIHKEEIAKKAKEWREANKEEIAKKAKEWRDKNREELRKKDRLRYQKLVQSSEK